MTCATCGYKATTLVEMANHKAAVHGDRTLIDRLSKSQEEQP